MVVTLGGLGWKFINSIKKNFNHQQKEFVDEIGQRLDHMEKHNTEAYRDMQKEILRLQILEGIDVKRLSPSEVRYFYDKYKAFGGNSFVTEKVHKYIEEIEGGSDNAKSNS